MSARRRLLVAGASARALAASAVAAGWDVAAIDSYNDADLQAISSECRLGGIDGRWLRSARAATSLPTEAFAYAAGLEHAPAAVEEFAKHRSLLGNFPATLTDLRDPLRLHQLIRGAGHASPSTRASSGTGELAGRWLLKPRRSGGGGGVRHWDGREPTPRSHVLQRLVRGVPGSLLFLADGDRVVPLALTRMLIGEPALGALGFRYVGTLVGRGLYASEFEQLLARATAAAETIARAYGLVGLNGLDFVAAGGDAHVIEVNPRWTAAVECIERSIQASVFPLHEAACRGQIDRSASDVLDQVRRGRVQGKAYVFARRDGTPPAQTWWARRRWVADIPTPDYRLRAGHAVCTVFGTGRDGASCRAQLFRRAAQVQRAIGSSDVLHFAMGKC